MKPDRLPALGGASAVPAMLIPVDASVALACFHCGLPLAGTDGLTVQIDGAARAMCCAGCRAVAQAIVGAGLESYYRHRQALPATAADTVPVELVQLALYDDPAVQSAFVRPVEGRADRGQSAPGRDEREAVLLIEGITCAACVWLVEGSLQRVAGVTGVQINYSTRRARIRWDQQRVALSSILQAVASVGYRACPFDAGRVDDLHRRERRRALAGLAIAGLGMMQVMMYAVPVYLAGADMAADTEQLMRWAGLVLTLPVLLYSAAPIFASAWRDMSGLRVGMDVPVALGIAVAFAASLQATLAGQGDVYFDSVTMFVFLLLAARFLESQVRARAARATDELARLIPAQAERLPSWTPQRRSLLPVETVAVAQLRAGDIVLVRPGARVPADGRVVDGEGEVDEALLTGESRPVLRGVGATMTGGAINLLSPLVLRVERVGEQTVLAGIVRLLDRAAAEKPPLAALADRVAGVFVLGLLGVAAATALWWGAHDPARALWVTVAVLVITCPCALSLATPAALAAATSSLARRGLLSTRGHAIETLARATHFVFDKTGTLTTGRLRVSGFEVEAADGHAATPADRAQCLAWVAALEGGSEHPIGRALREFAQPELPAPAAGDDDPGGGPDAGPDAGLDTGASLAGRVVDLSHVPGGGVQARVDGRNLRLGAPAFVAELSGTLPDNRDAGPMQRGDTQVVLGDRRGRLARFTLSDQIRPGARELLDRLQAGGAHIVLLSGDQPATVEAVAHTLGLAATQSPDSAVVRGGMTPQAKLAFVRGLQADGAVVAMFGDGVNDAPVLAQAQVSIALGCGTQVAQAAADMVWMVDDDGTDMGRLLAAIDTCRRTMRVIRQNLVWAAAYNLVAVPLAVAGMVTPWVAALGMSASSLLVVGNALRLLRETVQRASGSSGSPQRSAAVV